ncbi:hypothetical protein G6O67_004834 [Ophiocordyceps sinensis]|uniref:Uncharacterized protein n=1 Tax=Ophiocordyceps sinensis TaxID=72228 RepID=A0A8H4V571_9HYPO|nr:hypothetical protein G6O67_004834 [Ophiocordyceps sinensis]
MISMPTLTPSLPVSSESSRLGSYAVWRTLLLLFSLPDGLTASRRTCGPNRERLEVRFGHLAIDAGCQA